MQLELQSRLHCNTSSLATICLQHTAQQDLSSRTPHLVDQEQLTGAPVAVHSLGKSSSIMDQCPLKESSQDNLGPGASENTPIPQGVDKSGLVLTNVGHGQYICSGIPQLMAFGCPPQILPVKVEWPMIAGKVPVRTLYRSVDNARSIGGSPEKISYVVPVSTSGQSHRPENHTENKQKQPEAMSGNFPVCDPPSRCQTSPNMSPIQTPLLLKQGTNRGAKDRAVID